MRPTALLLLAGLAACGSSAPTVPLPTPFAPLSRAVGDGAVESATMSELVVRYSDVDPDRQWSAWAAMLEREGFVAAGAPSRFQAMRFATFTHPDGATRELMLTARGKDVIVHVSVE